MSETKERGASVVESAARKLKTAAVEGGPDKDGALPPVPAAKHELKVKLMRDRIEARDVSIIERDRKIDRLEGECTALRWVIQQLTARTTERVGSLSSTRSGS